MSEPTTPPAPGLFSTTTCWPSATRQLVGDEARDDVGRVAGRARRDELDGLGSDRPGSRGTGRYQRAAAASSALHERRDRNTHALSRPSRRTSSRRHPTSRPRPSRAPRIAPDESPTGSAPSVEQLLLHVGHVDDLHDLGVESLHDIRTACPQARTRPATNRPRNRAVPIPPASERPARPASAWRWSPRARAACPPWPAASAVVMLSNVIVTCPPITSCSAGGLPLYGMCCISTPAIDLNSSPDRCCDVPLPLDANVYLPGLAFISAISSATVFGGNVVVDDQHVRYPRDERDRHEVLDRVVGQVRVQRRVDRVGADRATHDRVAVGRRLGGEIRADAAARHPACSRRPRAGPARPTASR